MSLHLAFTPSGRVTVALPTSGEGGAARAANDGFGRAARAFATCQAAGLFALAVEKFESPPSPSATYWRDFAAKYLTELCHTPEIADARLEEIPPPTPAGVGHAAIAACRRCKAPNT